MEDKVLDYFNGDELAASTWKNKYAASGENTPDDTHKRLAHEFSRIEEKFRWNKNPESSLKLSNYGYSRGHLTEEKIYNLFKDYKYIIPGGSVMSGAGTNELVSLSNCFVVGSPKDSYADIMKTRSEQAQLMKRRGGVGYDLSELRPRGASVNNAAKTSTGAASFMDVCSDITNEVAQNGRRGALMLSMNINHPDIEEFITKKQDLTKVTGANISVKVTDEFMKAVEGDEDYYLRYPVDQDLSYFSKDYLDVEYNKLTYLEDHRNNNKIFYIKKVKAKELWNTLMHCAWNTAEPGIMFESTMHNYSPDGVYPNFKMVSTNPCGEIPMGPYDSCRLIHLNLKSFIEEPFTEKAHLNEELLYETAYEAMRLADDLVELEIEAVSRIINVVKDEDNKLEYELWNKINNTAIQGRRAGLGFTAMGDAIAMLGLKYDSEECLKMVDQIMKIIFLGELDSNIDMAIERGTFPAYDGYREWHLRENNEAKEGSNDWYEFIRTNFPERANRMSVYGRRNLSFSTVAPTGTVSLMARCSSGIEPIFMPFYQRKRKCMSEGDRVDYTDIKGEKYTLFVVVHPGLMQWASMKYGKTEEELNKEWTIKEWEDAFKESPYHGSTAPEINWHQRVKLQGIVQKYITHSISSTVNLDNKTTEEEIANIYIESWKEGLKGITIYRDGCREGVLTGISNESNNKVDSIPSTLAPKRPKELEADYYQVKVKGEQFIVVVGLMDGKPYEIFAFRPTEMMINFPNHKGKIIKVKKAKYSFESDKLYIPDLKVLTTDIEERAATLYSSMLLRHGVDIEFIIKTAKKVNDNIVSFSSAMCRILSKYVKSNEVKGEVCPECGGKLVRDGGCIHCPDCGWSRCS